MNHKARKSNSNNKKTRGVILLTIISDMISKGTKILDKILDMKERKNMNYKKNVLFKM